MTAVAPFVGSPAEWDAFVTQSVGWTHYHLHGWRRVFERVFPHECLYVGARDATGVLVGVLPLVRVKSRLFGHYLVSMPFLNYGGPLGDAAALAALTDHAASEAERTGTDLLELRSAVELPVGLEPSHRKITVVLPLPGGDADVLWRSLKAKVRSQVRRPEKEGVTVRFGADQVGPFFSVFARHMRDLGTPTHARKLFEAIAEEFGETAWFGVAWLAGEPIAAACGFRWGGQFELTWAAALKEHNRIAPNMLLYWRFMERCVAEGLDTFNFGRCTPGSGTHRFKRQWGGTDQPLYWYQKARHRAATPSPDDARFSWGPRLWRRLPVPLATLIGPRVVRYIP